jgi:hypothetical protein
MKVHLAFAAILLGSQLSCNTAAPPGPDDVPFVLQGLVVDEGSSARLSGVMIGFRAPAAPDSLVFVGDSIQVLESVVPIHAVSKGDGSFTISFVPGVRSTSRYRYLFAYKTGYQVWRSDRDSFELTQVNTLLDQVKVTLKPK